MCFSHLFIHSFVDWHVGLLHSLAIMNRSAANMSMHVSLQYAALSYFGSMPKSSIAWSNGISMSSFWGTAVLIFIVSVSVHAHQQCRSSLSPASSPAFVSGILNDSSSDWSEMESHCNFNLHFLIARYFEHFSIFFIILFW